MQGWRAQFGAADQRDLWNVLSKNRGLVLIFVAKFCESASYFSSVQVLTLFLTDELGFQDKSAGLLYGCYGALISIYGFFMGNSIDRLGVATSIKIGSSLSFIARGLLTITRYRWLMYLNLLVLLPIAGALGIPVLMIAVRRCTNEATRSFAFGIFYTIMNIAALLVGPMIDFLSINVSPDSPFSGNRRVLAASAVLSFCSLVASFRLAREPKLQVKTIPDQKDTGSSLALFRDPSFVRFFVLSILMTNLRGVFRHLDATLPKYLLRTQGPDVNKGLIYALDPLVVIVLVPVFGALLGKVDSFSVIIVGGYISATSPLYMAYTKQVWAAMAFTCQLGLGEALWSPRFLTYQATVAPEGKEAAFIAMSSAPLYLAKLPVGYFSGWLLQSFCPPLPNCKENETTCSQWLRTASATCSSPVLTGVCDKTCQLCDDCVDTLTACPEPNPGNTRLMWLIVCLMTVISPLLVHLFRNRLQEPKHKYTPARTPSEIEEYREDVEMFDIIAGEEFGRTI
mmetsp:Transcript_5274/g.8110  ORF Transcript_5274/g.8110 Transcript_5274/m.8110 type:complete len:511 (-) Transcript_5274:1012-2544(-)|eukprot:CAMPEP_0203761122 /NCGR_PEP_ID=MMETSP0098-20131031/14280_1 /ASSEMBLY_ACC=CAM_ASM_000208 /TAXON_ID=96639 /ORGANISM=" , Strain NY0313808BC1" /LENGTH=510 /DNA_ID=CAMNT_0050654981 /DNA_START=28 /DNA_END=1560 /DNA_ORIENTATION=+